MLVAHSHAVTVLLFSDDGRMLATYAYGDSTLCVWQVRKRGREGGKEEGKEGREGGEGRGGEGREGKERKGKGREGRVISGV